jgi:hypothetical protein
MKFDLFAVLLALPQLLVVAAMACYLTGCYNAVRWLGVAFVASSVVLLVAALATTFIFFIH